MTRVLRSILNSTLISITILIFSSPNGSALNIQEVETHYGTNAWLVENSTVPIIAVEIAFRGGANLDPPLLDGVANMVSEMLDEGAGNLNAGQFQAQLANLAIKFSSRVQRESFRVSFKTLKENREAAFKLVGLALTQPHFSSESIEKIRLQLLSERERASSDLNWIVDDLWRQTAFPSQPYGRSILGTAASINSITAAHLSDFAKTQFTTENLVVSVAGDITALELKRLLDVALSGLALTSSPAPDNKVLSISTGATVVSLQESSQSIIRFGLSALKRSDPDFFAAYVMNIILGGNSFTSRLHHEIREKRGIAYSVYTYLQTFEEGGLLVGHVACANGKVSNAIELIIGELDRLTLEQVPQDELNAAKAYLIGSYPLALSSNARIAGALTRIQLDNLGIRYLEHRSQKIEAVSVADVQRVAKRLIDTQGLIIAIAGNPPVID